MGSLDDIETVENWQERLTEWFQQMMFVSGETGEPSAETLTIIEAIVQQQVIEIVGSPIHTQNINTNNS